MLVLDLDFKNINLGENLGFVAKHDISKANSKLNIGFYKD